MTRIFTSLWKHVLALAGLLVATLPCTAADLPTVTFSDGLTDVGLLQVLRAKGICEKHGVKCELASFASSPLAVQAMVGGSIDVAGASTDVLLQAVVKGSPITILWGKWRYNPVFVAANAALDMPNLAAGYPDVMKDFKGKTIGVSARGASTEFQFVSMLQGAGMSRDDVTFVNVGGPSTAMGALKSRQVDAIVSWQPAGLLCTTDKFCKIAVDTRKNEGPKDVTDMNGAITVYAVRTNYLKDNEATMIKLLAAFKEADAWMHDPTNFDELDQLARSTLNFGNRPDADAVRRAFLNLQINLYYTAFDPKSVQAAADYLYSTKQINAKYDTSKLIWDKAPTP